MTEETTERKTDSEIVAEAVHQWQQGYPTYAACHTHKGHWFHRSTGACSCGGSHREGWTE